MNRYIERWILYNPSEKTFYTRSSPFKEHSDPQFATLFHGYEDALYSVRDIKKQYKVQLVPILIKFYLNENQLKADDEIERLGTSSNA